ncbi:hypothetical protein [Streptomyces sp. XD-27]|uniref:LppU/SCO3897 family protein n=1 Tax=Streptomyces sp. XD-27 TaxID=3062779 RepID=UPI0026F47008|nr:hypothetical protein [Streptomyces sp. XD-27]WKX71512.1 hypothetical protein Q3Y56_17770 [Streptomyces sp. XD-27]
MTTPPPQGQNPFAQQHPAPTGPAAFPPAPAPAPRRNVKKILRNVVLPIAGVSIAIGAYFAGDEEEAKKLAVGDCLQNKGGMGKSAEIEKLDCTDAKAKYKVLKKVDGTSIGQLACQGVQGSVVYFTWQEGSDGFTLCLGNNKK